MNHGSLTVTFLKVDDDKSLDQMPRVGAAVTAAEIISLGRVNVSHFFDEIGTRPAKEPKT
jgi:hypothetical protein